MLNALLLTLTGGLTLAPTCLVFTISPALSGSRSAIAGLPAG